MEERRRDIVAAVEQFNDGSGVILLTDMFGGTPSNLAISVMDAGRVEVVAGVNLPMLLRAVSYRNEPLDVLVQRALTGGTAGVMQVAVAAPQNQARRKHSDQDIRDHQQ
jgi:PTS system ascorbate-specific IIA component